MKPDYWGLAWEFWAVESSVVQIAFCAGGIRSNAFDERCNNHETLRRTHNRQRRLVVGMCLCRPPCSRQARRGHNSNVYDRRRRSRYRGYAGRFPSRSGVDVLTSVCDPRDNRIGCRLGVDLATLLPQLSITVAGLAYSNSGGGRGAVERPCRSVFKQ